MDLFFNCKEKSKETSFRLEGNQETKLTSKNNKNGWTIKRIKEKTKCEWICGTEQEETACRENKKAANTGRRRSGRRRRISRKKKEKKKKQKKKTKKKKKRKKKKKKKEKEKEKGKEKEEEEKEEREEEEKKRKRKRKRKRRRRRRLVFFPKKVRRAFLSAIMENV